MIIEDVDDDARACNISSDAHDASARLPLSNSKIRVSSSAVPYLYVVVTVMRLSSSGVCVACAIVKVKRFANEFSAHVAVCATKSQILRGNTTQFGSRVSATVEETKKMFIAVWLKANEQR